MRRFYRLLISTLVVIGVIAIAPASTPVEKTEQAVKTDCSDGELIASADVKKKKKKTSCQTNKSKKHKKSSKRPGCKTRRKNNFA